MKNINIKKLLAAATAGAMIFTACPTAFAEDVTPTDTDDSVYVLMNIPYGSFYAAEGDASVDAVSSATLSKPRTKSLANGSYHVNADGSDITGVTYAVKTDAAGLAAAEAKGGSVITDESSVDITTSNRGQTQTNTYSGKDALFEASSYSYYVLSEAPTVYKEMSVSKKGKISFGATNATTTTIDNADVTFATTSSYGDYQMTVNALSYDDNRTVYGVILNTTDGSKYGLRHVENIWRQTNIAWSTGHTTNVHGCELNTSDYKDMEGKSINSITYLTSDGNYKLKLAENAYVAPYYTLKANKIADDAENIAVEGIPSNARNVKASVYYTSGRDKVYVAQDEEVVDGKIALDEALDAEQTYTVTVTSSNYATINAALEDAAADDTDADDTNKDDTNTDDTNKEDTNTDDTNKDDTNTDDSQAEVTTPDNTTSDDTTPATVKASNKITCKAVTKTYKKSTLKKKSKTFKLKASNKANAKMTFSKKSGNKKIKVSSTGKVTVKKGMKKGTYKVKVLIKAAATSKYKAASKTVTIKVKVK